MSLGELAGATYGPLSLRIAPEKVAEFVAASGDSEAWRAHAPPGYAAALLFAIAPRFLSDPVVVPFTTVLIHVDQEFVWHRELRVGEALTLEAAVASVRERGGLYFVKLSAAATAGAEGVLDSTATFLMGSEGSGGTQPESLAPRVEPPVYAKGSDVQPSEPAADRPTIGAQATLHKSPSRADLVRYAGASGDWNPIHWDHGAAAGAGLSGVVVHGLLMVAWIVQAASSLVPARPDPLADVKVRFRDPLLAAQQATVAAEVTEVESGTATVKCRVDADGESLVTGVAHARIE